jgi:hypothetical protein
MIRGGSRSGRIACLLVGVCAALAAVVPTAASAQPAVDEYTLDIPGGGGGGDSAGGSAGVASASGGGAGGAGSSERGAESGQGGAEGTASGGGGAARGEEIDSSLDGSGSTGADDGSLDTSSRSAPEVVADTLFDSAMLPILIALVLITGVGAWRLVRHRRALSGQAS